MTRVLLAVGANLGDRNATLEQSLSALSHLHATRILSRSDWHETTPIGGPAGQPGFLNGAVLLETSLPPQDLASQLRQIERQLGRERHARWDARTIDLDLLLYGRETIATSELEIPHPRMAFRRFVLDPACEIAGEMIHPPSGWTLAALRRHWQALPRTVSVESPDKQLTTWLTAELAGHLRTPASDQSNRQTIELVESGDDPTMVIQLGKNSSGCGPVVSIASANRAVILQEALAAISAAWPD